MTFDKGYVAVARALENQYRLGVITEGEYRNGLRQAGQPLLADDVAFAPPAPLPPVDYGNDAWMSESTNAVFDDEQGVPVSDEAVESTEGDQDESD